MAVLEPSSRSATAHAPQRSRLAVLAALVALALLGATGCAAEVHTRAAAPAPVTYQEVTVYEEPVVHVAAAPAHIETYPRVYYRGTYVYYVDGRWYYPTRHGWVYYRDEPRALVHYRVDFDRRRAPHHHRQHVHRDPARRGHVHPAPARRGHVHPAPARRGHVHPAPARRGHVHPAPARRGHVHPAPARRGHVHRAPAARPATPARPAATVRAGATVKAGATVRAGAAARPATPARPTKKPRVERRRHHVEERRHER
ncbi:hypothetical protein WMF31_21375 [Sorangium sp. So ce1036]|uniref:hypothetical protein n=1 Tax=Sorangium sp. So ce1036 TaxID=3133328 RepID=UPI003EFE049F